MEDKEDGGHHAGEAGEVVPAQFLFQIEYGKCAEDDQGNDFLDGLELRGCEPAVANAVGRHLKAVLGESDPPTGKNGDPQRGRFVLQMAIPGEGHENVGCSEQDNGFHGVIWNSLDKLWDRKILNNVRVGQGKSMARGGKA